MTIPDKRSNIRNIKQTYSKQICSNDNVISDTAQAHLGREDMFTEITDDLTGAADSGSYFTGRGKKVTICLSGDNVLSRKGEEMISVNLSSRNTAPETARQLHFDLMKKLDSNRKLLIKKIGTGFRGNDSMEMKGLLEAEPDYLAFVIDHAPDLGTFTLYGNQYCEGEILTKSVYADDPVMPPKESFIPQILGGKNGIQAGLVDIDAVKGGKILEETSKRVAEGCRIIVFDAVTREDTRRLIETLYPVYKDVFWTGSLGIADGLAEYFLGDWQKTFFPVRNIRCLGFCASAYEIARKQIEYSRQRGLHVTSLDIDAYIDGDTEEIYRCIREMKESIKNENTLLLPLTEKYSYQPGTSCQILEAVGRIASEVCRSDDFERLIVIGGETSQNVFQASGVNYLELGRPLEPGTAQGKILDGIVKGKEFSLKGGSMGTEYTLEKMMCRKEVWY